MRLTHPPGDELCILRAEINDENLLGDNRHESRRTSVAHADALRLLQGLAFGLQSWGHHDLGLLELF